MPPKQEKKKDKLSLVATYDYRDALGNLVFQKQRFVNEEGKKTFRQRRMDADTGEWISNLDGVDKILYNLPMVASARNNGETIWVVEGEKDADTLIERGITATTMPGGAGKWLDIHTEALAGANVIVVADNDDVGKKHALDVSSKLRDAECTVELKIANGVKDVTDLLNAGGTLDDLVAFTEVDAVVQEIDPFAPILQKLEKLFANEKLSRETKLTRAEFILAELDTTSGGVKNEGRLVDWATFVNESENDAYDWVIPNLLERGERVIVVAAEGVGKRATLDSMIPTPSGWTTLGEISVGDKVIDRFGNPVTVTYVSPIESNPDAYRVTFSDGNHVDADAEHQWYTETLNEREKRKVGGVRTTKQILDTLVSNRLSKAFNHAIPTTKPLNLPEANLPIPPYTLGAWLGDGTTCDGSICSEDEEILDSIRNDGYVVRKRKSTTNVYGILGLQTQLKDYGLYGNKHIPAIYSRSSFEQRLALVQGLMDTDGYVDSRGSCEFSVTHQGLAKGFLDLILTLGIKATMRQSDSTLYGRVTGTRYRVSFKTDLPVCRVKRKAERLPKKLATSRSLYRYIVSVEPITPVPMRCISVDGPDNTYLIGDAYIPTHNTMLARQVALCCAAGLHPFKFTGMPPVRTLMVDLENPERIIRRTSKSIYGATLHYGHKETPDAHLLIKPDGIDLMKAQDRLMLEDKLEQIKPDIVFLGPLYKAFIDPGGRTSESIAIEIAKYFDTIREYFKCAMWFEHHAPLGSALAGRDLRPFGSAVWSRWPEFGLSLQPDPTAPDGYVYEVRHFRGARDRRQWPTRMKRGKVFPFETIEFLEGD
jgi:5S rRNA maturation endonuclease (ribonuclease M5)